MNIIKVTLISIIIPIVFLSINTTNAHVNSKLEQAINSNHRSGENKARDIYRHPKETLEFFGFKPSMTVVELIPDGLWYTEILAPALKGTGKLYGAQYPRRTADHPLTEARERLERDLASDDIYSEVEITDFNIRKVSDFAPAGSVDLILTFRNLHHWKEPGISQMFKDSFKALKNGGALGVVQHQLPEHLAWEDNKRSGYVPMDLVIKLATDAGFTLAGTSNVNNNSKDNAEHPSGVWTLPPAFALGDVDKDKYLAIGESNRMTLKFIE